MKITVVLLLAMAPVSFRIAWLMSRACSPTNESPISPSSSFCGTRAATESTTMMSTALLLMSSSAICIASSPLVGWLTSSVLQRDAELLGPTRVERVLGVDEGRDAAGPLGGGHGVEGERRLAARLGAEHLDDAAAGKSLAAEGEVDRQAAARDALDRRLGVGAQRHDRAVAELLLDLGERVPQDGIVVEERGRGP